MQSLLKNDSDSIISNFVKMLNNYLEESKIGFLFQLIDCMNLLGIAAFYLGNYDEAYESFLLVLELYQSFSERDGPDLKSECSQDDLNLHLDKIVYTCSFAKFSSPSGTKLFVCFRMRLSLIHI